MKTHPTDDLLGRMRLLFNRGFCYLNNTQEKPANTVSTLEAIVANQQARIERLEAQLKLEPLPVSVAPALVTEGEYEENKEVF